MTDAEFEQRIEIATAFEDKVAAALTERGWLAERFGQGQLSEGMRNVIKRVNTPTRWMPDIIAAKQFRAKARLIFVDAKSGEAWRNTGNHDIETAALEAAEGWEQFSGCPVYFVCSNGETITPAVFRELGVVGRYRGNGTGTPFLLMPRSASTSFNATFGPLDSWAG